MTNASESVETTLPEQALMRVRAYDRFMELLILRDIKPGQMLSQRELCDLLDMPMAPIRDALKRLEAEQFVCLVPRRGIRIVDIDDTVVNEVYQFRHIVEREALKIFMQNVPEDSVRKLLEKTRMVSVLEQSAEILTIEESLWMTSLDHEMHFMFIKSLNNRFVNTAFERLMGQLRLVRFLDRIRVGRKRNAFEEHIEILTHILEKRDKQAEEALVAHLKSSHDRAAGLI